MKSKFIKKISFFVLFAVIFSCFMFMFSFNVNAEEEIKANPSGAYLKYTVNVNKKEDDPALAYHFITLRKFDYLIQEGDMLEYDVYLYIDEKGWGAIDGEITGVGTIRDSGMSDTDGNGIHTGQDLSGEAFEQWYHRVIPFGITEDENEEKYTVGRPLKQIQLAMHPESDELVYTGVVLYDNIVITNNGEVKLVIFRDEADFVPEEVKFSHAQGLKRDDATVECLVFTPEEEQAFKDAEEAKIKEQESREASKAEAEASKQASIEQASIDASLEASIEEANRTEAINEPTTSENSDGNDIPVGIIIGIAAGIIVLIVIILIIVTSSKKKGGKK
ncbi:MAG: hypothetical protein FWF92_01660 [Oscillospiraceae bacterium]|nr:hypothetical protein [Oscillospiraceae bacterium]